MRDRSNLLDASVNDRSMPPSPFVEIRSTLPKARVKLGSSA
jgi:hypothetical protein